MAVTAAATPKEADGGRGCHGRWPRAGAWSRSRRRSTPGRADGRTAERERAWCTAAESRLTSIARGA
eukprot:11556535-Heterocapsa_arctica.AAC.1